MLFGKPATPVPISVRLANFAIHATLAGGWSIAGVLIGRALRIGGILALVMFLIPLAGAVVFGLPVPRLSLVVAVVGVGLTLSVFNELK